MAAPPDQNRDPDGPWCQIIDPPNLLKIKVGVSLKPGTAHAVEKAEKALKDLSPNFDDWVEQEVQALEAARAVIQEHGLNDETVTGMTSRALDLKGLGATYGYPLLARVAASLFRLIDGHVAPTIPMALVDAHVDTARSLIRGRIRSDDHPVGVALVCELERQVLQRPATAPRR